LSVGTMLCLRFSILFALCSFCALTIPAPRAFGQGAGSGNSFLAGGSFLYLSNSTTQGGTGAKGYSLITEGEILYSSPYLASGAFFNYEHQGQYERDSSFGYKMQLGYGGAYFEYGYAFLATRAFTDRSIAQQRGTASQWGFGLRVTSALFPRILFQLNIKTRTQVLTKQDGKTLDEGIIQTNTFPLLGVAIKI